MSIGLVRWEKRCSTFRSRELPFILAFIHAGKMSPESFLEILYLSRGLGFDPIFARIKFSTA